MNPFSNVGFFKNSSWRNNSKIVLSKEIDKKGLFDFLPFFHGQVGTLKKKNYSSLSNWIEVRGKAINKLIVYRNSGINRKLDFRHPLDKLHKTTVQWNRTNWTMRYWHYLEHRNNLRVIRKRMSHILKKVKYYHATGTFVDCYAASVTFDNLISIVAPITQTNATN